MSLASCHVYQSPRAAKMACRALGAPTMMELRIVVLTGKILEA
jgi:hypothetical protein